MKMKVLVLLAFAALSIGLVATARADWVNVNLDFTLRGYQSQAEAACTAHGDHAGSHIGMQYYDSGNDVYRDYVVGFGHYGPPPPPYNTHKPAEADAWANMQGQNGPRGSASMSASTGVNVFDGSGAVTVICGTGAGGSRNDDGWSTATCVGTVPLGPQLLYIGTSTQYPMGAPLYLDVEFASSDTSHDLDWSLQVAGRQYSMCWYGLSVSDRFLVEAGRYYDFGYLYSTWWGLSGPEYQLSESSTGYVTLTLMDDVIIPEPSALVLLGTGVVALLALAWRRRG